VRKIDWYIFRQLLTGTLVVSVTLTGVVWLMQSLRFIEMIVNRGLSVSVFVYFTLLLLPSILSLILPIAIVIAVIFTYNRLSSDSELVVIRAGGSSHISLAKPALWLSILGTLLCYSLTIYVLPSSFRAFKDLQFKLRNSFPAVLLQEGVFSQISKGITVYIEERTADGSLKSIVIHDSRKPTAPVTMMADKGLITSGKNGPRIILIKGNRQLVDNVSRQLSLLYFDRYSLDLTTVDTVKTVRWREPKERYLHELFHPKEEEKTLYNYHKLRMEGHYRLSMPLLPVCLVLVALAVLLQSGGMRRSQIWHVITAAGLSIFIISSHFGLQNLGVKHPKLMPGIYLTLVFPAACAFFLLTPGFNMFRRFSAPKNSEVDQS
jgi:lipopolysaccharide export system permease protein